MSNILRQLLTGIDGQTHDVMRWIGLGGAVTALVLQVYVVVFKSQPFDLQAFGIGMGALCASVGAAIALKKKHRASTMNIQCFVVEPTDQYDVFLRRFSFSESDKHCPHGKGYHEALTLLERLDKKDTRSYNNKLDAAVVGDYWPHNDSRWPAECKCGFRFRPWDEWQYAPRAVHKRVDTGELALLKDFPAGAMWRSPWLEEEEAHCTGSDGASWSVRTPGGDWLIDGRAGNCTMPDDTRHKCWVRHGEAPLFSVDKDGYTCSAGAGSIVCGSYHGFLRSGYLEQC